VYDVVSRPTASLRVRERLCKSNPYKIQPSIKPITEANMMDQIFDWCVQLLVYWADILGITYKEINVWVFVILWPVLTMILLVTIIRQRQRIQQLSNQK
jgi:hypothetical protein